MIPKEESFYVTLDESGNGSVQFTARKPGILYRVTKVTVEMDAISSGLATIERTGQFLSSMPVNRRMETVGEEGLYNSEFLTGRIIGGPLTQQVKWSFFYVEEPEAGAVSVRGMRFMQQQQVATPVDDPVLLASTDQQLGNPFGWETGPLDMRAYNSYHLTVDISGGTWTDTDMAEIEVKFFDEYPVDITVPHVFAETYFMYRNTSSEFPVSIADAVHGGWMTINVIDWSGGPRSTNLVSRLYGSYRSVPSVWIRPHPGNGNYDGANVLYDNEVAFVAAGAQSLANAKFALGRARVRLESTAGSVNMQINYGSVISTLRDSLALSAAGITEKEIILPVRQARVIITNGPTAVNTVRAQIIQERFPQ